MDKPFTVNMNISPVLFELPERLFIRAIHYELQMIAERLVLEWERRRK